MLIMSDFQLGLEELPRDRLCLHEDVVARVLSVMMAHGTAQRWVMVLSNTFVIFILLLCRLVRFEIPRAVFLVSQPWTPESGLLTAAMKLKREYIRTVYGDQIVELYAGNNNAGGTKNMCS